MSIKSNIRAGCLSLTLLTLLMGSVAEIQGRRLGDAALKIYDNAFMAMSYLREAQLDFVRVTAPATGHQAASAALGRQMLDDLDVVSDRATAPAERARAAALRGEVAALLPHLPGDRESVADAEHQFAVLVETFAGDGYRYRTDIGNLVHYRTEQTTAFLTLLLLAALGITAVVSNRIARPVQHAVRIAQSIAAGRLDNIITPDGEGETRDLLSALAVMQANIAAAMARIRGLLAEQAASHAGEIARQNARMELALSNITRGLCLFDSAGRLLLSNRCFAELFGCPVLGATAAEVLHAAGLDMLTDAVGGGEVQALTCTLPDGRSIAVRQQPAAGGGWVATFEDISERRDAEQRLAHMARHDQLTGLANRLLFSEHMARVLPAAAPGKPVAVLSLDLDRFKSVNDGVGHPAGDALLRAVAARLLDCAGSAALVARMGGDEFAIVQPPDSGPHAASLVAQRVIASLAAPFVVDERHITIGASVGIALTDDPNVSADELLKRADRALYRAKADGRGQFRYFEAAMEARRILEQDLNRALAEDEFELFYQPLVGVGQGIAGFEALLRWRHPQHGLVTPDKFIQIAEDTGLIQPIGSWVLRRACTDAAAWPGHLKVAVNLSPRQFRGDVIGDVTRALESSGLLPSQLELEITESLFLQDDDAVLTTLRAIRAMGVRIAMDDFGTGYSSLSYLQRFPFDKIKIDKTFVQGVTSQPDCLAIVRAVIGLGRSLGMMVNAEGVETQAQCAVLIGEGCGELQGYLFSRPQPAAAVPGMLQTHYENAMEAPHADVSGSAVAAL